MLSVLIPVYNFNVSDLVGDLCSQAKSLGIPFEVIVIDDASNEEFRKLNVHLKDADGVVYIEEASNLGRSRIRNKLADIARFDNLLFLDCDSRIDNPDYIQNYLDRLHDEGVIYGGREYIHDVPEDKRLKLHWLHGVYREEIPVKVRSHEPNRSFMTNNFMITRKAFDRVRFNEKIRGYGHEDTLFGYDLAKCNIAIQHIDNPVIHLGLESSEEFLRKTREGIKNLKRIMKINGNEKKLQRDITLLAYYKGLRSVGMDGVFRYIYQRFEMRLRKNLMSENPNLIVFDLYKLGYLCSLNGELK
ncbi:MAG: glycosyltransferase family 2 protein [Bacteroidales bacterium]|nr:glycosyltransferase family 2 protein [Bacteroidales bacterium]